MSAILIVDAPEICGECAGRGVHSDGALCEPCEGSGRADVPGELDRQDIETAQAQHLRERAEALREAIDGGDFEHDPYSIHVAPTTFIAPSCGICTGRIEKECDGDSVWSEWRWFRECPTARGECE